MIISKCNSNLSELNRIFRIGHNPCPARKKWMEARGGSLSCNSSYRGRWHGGQDRPPVVTSSLRRFPVCHLPTCPRRRFRHLPIAWGRPSEKLPRTLLPIPRKGPLHGLSCRFPVSDGPKRSGPESPHWPCKSLSWGHHIQYQKGLSGLMAGSKPAATSIKTQAPHTETVLPFLVNSGADQVSFSIHQGQHLTCKYQQGNFSSRTEK